MNSFGIAVFAFALAFANAGVITHSVVAPIASGTTLQGPSTRSAVVGPDGTSIVSAAPGGVVSTSVDVGYAVHGAGVVAAAPAVVAARYAAPALVSAYSAPVVAHHAAPLLSAYSAPVLAHHGLYGSGVVARSVLGAPLAVYPEGSGLEGQYVHDYTETLYDDGSYKPGLY